MILKKCVLLFAVTIAILSVAPVKAEQQGQYTIVTNEYCQWHRTHKGWGEYKCVVDEKAYTANPPDETEVLIVITDDGKSYPNTYTIVESYYDYPSSRIVPYSSQLYRPNPVQIRLRRH
jgi:hypothetical protein